MSQKTSTRTSETKRFKEFDEITLLGNLSIKHFELLNGLQVAVVVDHTTPIFSYQTWFNVGSADEPAGHQGLAHLFEHMMFRKTERHAQGEFERIVNANGGTGTNAYTSRDQTVYFVNFPNDKIEVAVELESDRMAHLVIDSKTFETEKGAVVTEKNRGLDDPVRFLWEEVYKLAYTHHSYRYSTIGETETIKNFTVREANDFYKSFYAPNNALIIVVGDVQPNEVINCIVEYYGSHAPSQMKVREITTEPIQTEERTITITHPKAVQPMLAKVWHIPSMTDPDYPAFELLGQLLTSGKSAVLNERLLNTAIVSKVFSGAQVSKDMGTFELFAQLPAGGSFEIVEEVFHESMSEIAEGIINDDQIQIVKNNVQKEIYQSVTSPATLARLLGDGFINAGDLSFQISVIEKIMQMTKADIGRVAKRYVLNGKSTTAILHPEGR